MPEILHELELKLGIDSETLRKHHSLIEKTDSVAADVLKGHKYERGDINVKQDYEKAAEYFAKAASHGNAEGMYNLARLHQFGLGVKEDHYAALKLLEQAAEQPPEHPVFKGCPNVGVAEAEHAIGVRYFEGITVSKNLSLAAYWYKRASDHGCAIAANNLGAMYLDGLAVGKDREKAEHYLELGAKRGDPLAMMSLAELLFNNNDFQMAKIWYNRACDSGNIMAQKNRDGFLTKLEARQKRSPKELETLSVMTKAMNSLQIKVDAAVVSDHSYLQDYSTLSEHAKRGSITAKQMCDALDHLARALNIFSLSETLTEKQEDIFIHELSQVCRIEPIAVQIPCEVHPKIIILVARALDRCTKQSNFSASQLDEDVRLCYASLNFNSYDLIDQFVDQCKQKYPKSIYFYRISGAANGFLRRPEKGLQNINAGLDIEPNNCELLYHRAVLLRHLKIDSDDAIKAYETFIRVAPKDHRKVPEAYYEMALCPSKDSTPDAVIDRIKKLYMEGQRAEKLQLPCFLPYKSENIAHVKFIITMAELHDNIEPVPIIKNRKQRLADSHRVEVITKHRQWEGQTLQEQRNPRHSVISASVKSRVKQQTAKSLIGLKSITLKEMDQSKDHVYNGYVLSVIIIDETYSWTPSIHLVIEDENFDCERMLIYGFPKKEGQYLIRKVYTIGSKIHIINPYFRMPIDRQPTIRVDDLSSIVMDNGCEPILNMCRYCCEANAPHVCIKCQRARYCSKECQTMDWKLYNHKLICYN